MKLLLDTHAFLWWIGDNPNLSSKARRLCEDGNNEIFFSAASGWEMAIKAGLGRLVLPDPPEEFIVGNLKANAFQILPVHLNHTCRVRSLPDHHRDPFDRLLVAQAQIEGLGLVSKDEVMSRYPVEVFW